MKNTEVIIDAIEARISNSKDPKYTLWNVGLTNSLDLARQKWGEPVHWIHWELSLTEKPDFKLNLDRGRSIVEHFEGKGMKNRTVWEGLNQEAVFVFIF